MSIFYLKFAVVTKLFFCYDIGNLFKYKKEGIHMIKEAKISDYDIIAQIDEDSNKNHL